jgi:hypothetical protein
MGRGRSITPRHAPIDAAARARATRRRTWLPGLALLLATAAGGAVPACIASGPPLDPITQDDDDGFVPPDADPPDALGDVPITEPHAVVGATPSRGPFAGGQRVVIRGNGFSSAVRVWFGDVEATELVPIDATRVQAVAPPGEPGPVDLTTQNGDDTSTRRTLAAGYVYEALYAQPSSGPVSGGNEIRILGAGTAWGPSTQALIDNQACATLDVVSPTELRCTVPKGTPGAKTVRTITGDQVVNVLDGYTYEDSTDGFKGGLSGDPLDGELRVLVYDNFTGDPVPGANVIVGAPIESAIVRQVDESGVVVITDPSLDGPRTVTVALTCFQPITFVDVPVDTVTVYLDPVLSPACGSGGDPPPVGGKSGSGGRIDGELVWPGGVEFKRAAWNVPPPANGDERQAAYVFQLGGNPLGAFSLPSPNAAVLPSAEGTVGYAFRQTTTPGNRSLYAVAGIENLAANPPRFIAYSMGVVKGVPVLAGQVTDEVFIQMQPLELALELVASPPPPGPSGPDRLSASVAIRFGNEGVALLPGGLQTPPLPLSGPLDFVGLPLLAGAFEGATYLVSARAVTGSAQTAPMSVVGSVQTNTTAFPVTVGDFVGLPDLVTPAASAAWNGRDLELAFGPGAPVDLSVYEITAGGGLVRWMVAVPGGARAVELPSLDGFPGAGLPKGAVTIGTYGARIDDFDYGALRYRNLRPAGMTAYSLDFRNVILP